jgi:hypothetical protein
MDVWQIRDHFQERYQEAGIGLTSCQAKVVLLMSIALLCQGMP